MVYYYMTLASDLRLQASTPSNHLRSARLFAAPPQFLNQAPPGAQQLTRPDFANVPHFRHVIASSLSELLTDTVFDVGTLRSRLGMGNGRRVTY